MSSCGPTSQPFDKFCPSYPLSQLSIFKRKIELTQYRVCWHFEHFTRSRLLLRQKLQLADSKRGMKGSTDGCSKTENFVAVMLTNFQSIAFFGYV
jgi:hypothetical protein